MRLKGRERMDDYPTCIDVCDGKYTIIYDLNEDGGRMGGRA